MVMTDGTQDLAAIEVDTIQSEAPATEQEDTDVPPIGEHDTDRLDYAAFLQEYGFTEELMQSVVQDRRLDHPAPKPEWLRSILIGRSGLHGIGLFAVEDLAEGEEISPARVGGLRAPAGRYTNHAKYPNCVFVRAEDGDLYLVARRDIRLGDELTVDYRQSARVNGWDDQFPEPGIPAAEEDAA